MRQVSALFQYELGGLPRPDQAVGSHGGWLDFQARPGANHHGAAVDAAEWVTDRGGIGGLRIDLPWPEFQQRVCFSYERIRPDEPLVTEGRTARRGDAQLGALVRREPTVGRSEHDLYRFENGQL